MSNARGFMDDAPIEARCPQCGRKGQDDGWRRSARPVGALPWWALDQRGRLRSGPRHAQGRAGADQGATALQVAPTRVADGSPRKVVGAQRAVGLDGADLRSQGAVERDHLACVVGGVAPSASAASDEQGRRSPPSTDASSGCSSRANPYNIALQHRLPAGAVGGHE